MPWLECDRLQLGSWPQRGRRAASSSTAGQMGQEEPGTRAVCPEAGAPRRLVKYLSPPRSAPDYSYWTKTLRNYLTHGVLFILLGSKAGESGHNWAQLLYQIQI